jgi:hypothetical protein
MTDIVERLRRFAKDGAGVAVLIDAASEIERLSAANQLLSVDVKKWTDAYEITAAQVEKVRSTIKWTNEVYPSRIYAQGARVELTWDEFNAMREAAGFKPAKRIGDEEGNAGINHRLRVRVKELEAQLALSSTEVLNTDTQSPQDTEESR